MLEEGMSANDAFDVYRRDEYNDKHAAALAELGVPETEFAQLQTQDGFFDPTLVSRRTAAAKAEAEARKIGAKAHPLDTEIKFLQDRMEERQKRAETLGQDITKDQVYSGLTKQLDKKTAERMLAFNPLPKAKVSTLPEGEVSPPVVASAPSVVAAPPVFDVTISPEENQKRQEKFASQAKDREVADTVARAWTDKKLELTDKIASVYKTPEEILAVAHAIDANGPITSNGKTVPYLGYIADKIGVKSSATAFEEPENKRWGTQKVTNNELLKVWAKSILKAYKAQQEASTPQKSSDKGVKVTQIE
jgi:hypothetical protein